MVLFVDANVFVDHFAPNPATGASCTAFLRRVANQEIKAITSTHVIGEMAHRLLTLEACAVFGWPYKGIAQRLAGHPADIQKLSKYRQAIDEVPLFGVQVLPVVRRTSSWPRIWCCGTVCCLTTRSSSHS